MTQKPVAYALNIRYVVMLSYCDQLSGEQRRFIHSLLVGCLGLGVQSWVHIGWADKVMVSVS